MDPQLILSSDSDSESDHLIEDNEIPVALEDDVQVVGPVSSDEEEIPTDEDDPGSLVGFIVNDASESEEEEEEEEEEAEFTDDDDESDDDYDSACESDDSYVPQNPVPVPDKPVRRSTRKRKVRQMSNPVISDSDDISSTSDSDSESEYHADSDSDSEPYYQSSNYQDVPH